MIENTPQFDPQPMSQFPSGNLEQHRSKLDLSELEQALLQRGTRAVTLQTAHSAGEHLFITVSDAGPYAAIRPLVWGLAEDVRCSRVTLLLSGAALNEFNREERQTEFQELSSSDLMPDAPILSSIVNLDHNTPVDTIISTPENGVGPQMIALYGSGLILNPRRSILIVESPDSSLGYGIQLRSTEKPIDNIDLVLCNDKLTRQVVLHRFPEIASDRVVASGTGQLLSFDPKLADIYRENGRNKIGIAPDEKAILFLGDFPDYQGISDEINLRSLDTVILALETLARDLEGTKIALLVRPHPGSPDRETLLKSALQFCPLASNFRLLSAARDICSSDEACYAADLITSTTRTEILKAPYRGKHGVFLAYSDLGEKILRDPKLVLPPVRRVIESQSGISVVTKEMDTYQVFQKQLIDPPARPLLSRPFSMATMLNEILPPVS